MPEVLLVVPARSRQALLVGGSPPKRGPGKQGSGGRRQEKRARGRCWEGQAVPGPRGGGHGLGAGRGWGRGRGRRAAHFLLGPRREEDKAASVVLGPRESSTLAPFAAGNSLGAGVGSPVGPRGSSGGRVGRRILRDSAGVGLRAGAVVAAGPVPLRRPGPGPWPAGRGWPFLALAKLRGPRRPEPSEPQAPRGRRASSRESFSRFLNFVQVDSVRAPGPRGPLGGPSGGEEAARWLLSVRNVRELSFPGK